MTKADQDPFDDPSYQRWMSQVASTCRARDKPCGGCQAGGICDGAMGGGLYDDDDLDYGSEDHDEG